MSDSVMLAHAVNAIELAGEAKTDGLKEFCRDNGLSKEDIDFLVTAKAPTTPGRVQARIDFNAQLEAETKTKKSKK